MTIEELKVMILFQNFTIRIENHDIHPEISTFKINHIFNISRVIYPDEINKPKFNYICFEEFYEVLVRIADYCSYPMVFDASARKNNYEVR